MKLVRMAAMVVALALALAGAGCDYSVTNNSEGGSGGTVDQSVKPTE